MYQKNVKKKPQPQPTTHTLAPRIPLLPRPHLLAATTSSPPGPQPLSTATPPPPISSSRACPPQSRRRPLLPQGRGLRLDPSSPTSSASSTVAAARVLEIPKTLSRVLEDPRSSALSPPSPRSWTAPVPVAPPPPRRLSGRDPGSQERQARAAAGAPLQRQEMATALRPAPRSVRPWPASAMGSNSGEIIAGSPRQFSIRWRCPFESDSPFPERVSLLPHYRRRLATAINLAHSLNFGR